jgi:hypothetical protein
MHDTANKQEWTIGKGTVDVDKKHVIISKVDLKDPVLQSMRSKRQQQIHVNNCKPQLIVSELRPPICPEVNIVPETIQTYRHQGIESRNIADADEVVIYSQSIQEYDEEGSHESFLKALMEWRQNGKESSDVDHENVSSSIAVSSEAGTETASSKINNSVSFQGRINFQKSLSYFDRLNLNKMRADVNNKEITSNLNSPKPQTTEVISHAPYEEDTIIEYEDDQIHNYGLQNMQLSNSAQDGTNEISEISEKINISIEDISDNVDQVIIDCLDRGQMVECIPSSKLIFVEPI